MEPLLMSQLLAGAALIFAAAGLFWLGFAGPRSAVVDRAPAKGSPDRGVLYALTLGMAPWAKESTRRHTVAYLRGVGFHAGLFLGLLAFFTSLWWDLLPRWASQAAAALIAIGALLALAGLIMRLVEPNLRSLSTPDDYAAILLVGLFMISVAAALLVPTWKPVMYGVSAVMLVYIPLGKIRHCLFFFFSRRFFGQFIGRRAVIHAEVPR